MILSALASGSTTSLLVGAALLVPGGIHFVMTLVGFILSKTTEIVVTEMRVYGTVLGKQVDLPLDSISSVGTTWLKGLMVATSSGKISFYGVENRDKVYQVINSLLLERQSNARKGYAQPTAKESGADELKKYKDLYDQGIISQEEFDAKKKQILGL